MSYAERPRMHPWELRSIDRAEGLDSDYVLRMENRPLWQTPYFDTVGDWDVADDALIERAERGEVWGGSLTATAGGRSTESTEKALLNAVFKKKQIRQCWACRQSFGCNPKDKFTECEPCRQEAAAAKRRAMRQWPASHRVVTALPPIFVTNGVPHKGDGGIRVFQPQTEAEAEAYYEGLRREKEWRSRQAPSAGPVHNADTTVEADHAGT